MQTSRTSRYVRTLLGRLIIAPQHSSLCREESLACGWAGRQHTENSPIKMFRTVRGVYVCFMLLVVMAVGRRQSLLHALKYARTEISKAVMFPPAGMSLSQIVSCSAAWLNKTKRKTNPPETERKRKYSCCILCSSV